MGRAEESFSRTQLEIAAEKAAALRRISEALQATLDELARRREAAVALDGAEGETERDACCALRRRAKLYRWYLMVQRESVGVWRHDALDDLHPIPRPLDAASRHDWRRP